jgi:hypothetical protein
MRLRMWAAGQIVVARKQAEAGVVPCRRRIQNVWFTLTKMP